MRYGEIKRAALELINQYSIAGGTIPGSYNNQSDYVSRIPFLLSSAFMDIRTGIKPKRAVYPVKVEGENREFHAVQMPKDCRRIISGGIRTPINGGLAPAVNYRFYGDNQIWFLPGEYLVEYEQFPTNVPASVQDTDIINEDPDVIQAAIYYAAAHLVRQDSEFDYAALMNEYEDRKARLAPAPYAEIVPVQDVYGF